MTSIIIYISVNISVHVDALIVSDAGLVCKPTRGSDIEQILITIRAPD